MKNLNQTGIFIYIAIVIITLAIIISQNIKTKKGVNNFDKKIEKNITKGA